MKQWSWMALKAVVAVGLIIVVPACSKNAQSSNPPFFLGVTGATAGPGKGTISLEWGAATDYSGTGITYFIYPSIGSGNEMLNSSTPYFTSTVPTLASPYAVSGLTSSDPYFFVVLAVDGTGAQSQAIEYPPSGSGIICP